MKKIKDYLHLEEWRDIPNVPFYQASNIGRIRSTDKTVKHNYGGEVVKKGKVLSQYINTKGYYSTGITLAGKTKTVSVHKLVALAWKSNPLNKPTVNHIDTVKTNNCEWNLEWATQKEQVHHALANNCRSDFSLSKETIEKIVTKKRKPVVLERVDTGQKVYFSGLTIAAYAHGLSQSALSVAIKRNSPITSKVSKKEYKVYFDLIPSGLAIDATTLQQ